MPPRTSSCSLDCGELIDRNLVALMLCHSTLVAFSWWARASSQPQTWRKWHSLRRHCLLEISLLSCLQTFQCRLLLGNHVLAWGVYHFRLCNNTSHIFHIAVIEGFISQAVYLFSWSCAGCCEIISAIAPCTFRSPRWTLAFFEGMCFTTEFACLRFRRAAFLVLVITAAWWVFIFHGVNIFVVGARSFSLANSLPQNSCKDRYTLTEWGSVLAEAVCDDLECTGQPCHE